MKKLIFFFILFLAIVAPLRAEVVSLSLDEAIAISLRDNRDILLRAEDVNKAKAIIKEANAGLFPTLTVSGGWTYTRSLYEKDYSENSGSVILKQPLYQGGAIINTIKQSKYGLSAAEAVLDKTKLELVLNVKRAFYTLLLAQEYSRLTKQILDNSRAHLEVIKARYQTGESSQSDILRIEDSLSSVEEAYEVALNQVESSKALLRNLLFLEEGVDPAARGGFIYEQKEVNYDEAFLKAFAKRPEIREYEARVKASQMGVEIAKAGSRPTIYASWDYFARTHAPGAIGPEKNWNDYNVIGIIFSWPIFDGWATKAKVEQAIVDLKETQLLKEKTAKDIALELKEAYLALKNAIAAIKTSDAEVNLYNDTLSVTLEQYKAGITSSLDLDDASLGYQVSLFKQKEAGHDYILAKARFEKATGDQK